MRYLLDTCTLLWFFAGSDNIPPSLQDELTSPACTVHYSDITILEVVIKYQLGKLPLPKPPSKFLMTLADKHQIDHLPLTSAAIFGLETLPVLHRDPFDRLLVSQANSEGMTLVTPDTKIHAYDVRWRWA